MTVLQIYFYVGLLLLLCWVSLNYWKVVGDKRSNRFQSVPTLYVPACIKSVQVAELYIKTLPQSQDVQ